MALLVLLAFIFLAWVAFKGELDGPKIKPKHSETEKPQTAAEKIDKDFANEAVKFFNGYLSLCKNHKVVGVSSLLGKGRDEFGINARIECIIIAIDDEHGDEAFQMVARIWSDLRREKMDAGDYKAVTYAGDGYVERYFGCKNLHYAFTEGDEYEYKDGQAVLGYDRPLFTRSGYSWDATLAAIKKGILELWPDAVVKVGPNGMSVDCE